MKYVVNMTDQRGVGKIKTIEALSIKEAEQKAKKKYPSHEVVRISKDDLTLDYYSNIKRGGLDG
jgi:hypothetical protein|tara:strand:+ start:2846 stop:3037 length:192 start_codon:yes stop_codon:yes gene_type:complete